MSEASHPEPVRRILLVEDHVPIQKLVRSILEREGCTVVMAADGLEALAVIGAGRKAGSGFDLYLVDYHMPRMGGLEFLQQLRDDPTPAIVLSGTAKIAEIRESVLKAGAVDTLKKPFTVEELRGVIQQYCGHKTQKSGGS